MPDTNSDTIIAAVMEQLVAECGPRAQRCRLRLVVIAAGARIALACGVRAPLTLEATVTSGDPGDAHFLLSPPRSARSPRS
jgi:hypothetical protein